MATIGRLAYQVVADVQQFAQGMILTRSELREARRAFVETRRPAELYGMAVDALAKQHEKGALDAQTYSRRLAQLKGELDDLSGASARRAEVAARNMTAEERYRAEMQRLNQEMARGVHETQNYTREAMRLREVFLRETGVTAELAAKQRELAESSRKAAQAQADLAAKGAAVTASMRTSAEQYSHRIGELNGLLGSGAISQQTYGRAVARAREEMLQGTTAQNGFTSALNQAGVSTGLLSLAMNPLALAIAAVVAVATAAVTALFAMASAFRTYVIPMSEAVEKTLNHARALQISTREMVGFQHAAKLAGIDADTFGKSLDTMTRRISQASGGTGPAVKALQDLGLSARELEAQGPAESFLQIADAISKLPTAGQQAAAAFALFGANGQKLLAIMKEGRSGIEAWMKDAEEMGITFTEAQGAQIAAANTARERVIAAFKGIALVAAVELSPAIQAVSEWLIEIVTNPVIKGVLAEAFRFAGHMIILAADYIHSWIALFLKVEVVVLRIVQAFGKLTGNDGLVAEAQARIEELNETIAATPSSIMEKIEAGAGTPAVPQDTSPITDETPPAVREATQDLTRWNDVMREGQQVTQSMRTASEKHADTFAHLTQLLAVGAINWETYRRAVAEANKELRDADPAIKAARKAMEDAASEGRRIYEETRTPQEKFAAEMADLESLLQVGAISWDTYMRAVAKASAELKGAGDAAGGVSEEQRKLEQNAKQFTESAKTPLDRYKEEVAKIRDTLAAGLITEEVAASALANAARILDSPAAAKAGSGVPQAGSNKVLEAGTADAFSEILRHRRGGDSKPMEKVEKIAQAQLTTLEEIKDEIRGNNQQFILMAIQ